VSPFLGALTMVRIRLVQSRLLCGRQSSLLVAQPMWIAYPSDPRFPIFEAAYIDCDPAPLVICIAYRLGGGRVFFMILIFDVQVGLTMRSQLPQPPPLRIKMNMVYLSLCRKWLVVNLSSHPHFTLEGPQLELCATTIEGLSSSSRDQKITDLLSTACSIVPYCTSTSHWQSVLPLCCTLFFHKQRNRLSLFRR
jgi:hypothetical protein